MESSKSLDIHIKRCVQFLALGRNGKFYYGSYSLTECSSGFINKYSTKTDFGDWFIQLIAESDDYVWVWQLIRSTIGLSSKVGWKWSEKCRKSEVNLIWCISTTNNAKSMKQLKGPTSLIHWFPVEMVHNGPKLCKHKRVFLCCKLMYPGYAILKLTFGPF